MEEETVVFDKHTALTLLRAKFEDFYNKNAARNPEKVNKIKFFMDWLKTATEQDVTVSKQTIFRRECNMVTRAEYHMLGHCDVSFYGTLEPDAYVTDNNEYASYFRDVYFSTEANSKIVPANLDAIAENESKYILKSVDAEAMLDKCILQRYEIGDPEEYVFYKCAVTYPEKTNADGTKSMKTLDFICCDGKCMIRDIENLNAPQPTNKTATGGCYVATAVYGSYDCPQVWTLRRYRDDVLGATRRGRLFIKTYYAISPTLVKWFGKTAWFKRFWRKRLNKLVNKLNAEGITNTPYEDKVW